MTNLQAGISGSSLVCANRYSDIEARMLCRCAGLCRFSKSFPGRASSVKALKRTTPPYTLHTRDYPAEELAGSES
jgi:hypothetical protein